MIMKHCTKFQVSLMSRLVGEMSTSFCDRQTEGQTESTKTCLPQNGRRHNKSFSAQLSINCHLLYFMHGIITNLALDWISTLICKRYLSFTCSSNIILLNFLTVSNYCSWKIIRLPLKSIHVLISNTQNCSSLVELEHWKTLSWQLLRQRIWHFITNDLQPVVLLIYFLFLPAPNSCMIGDFLLCTNSILAAELQDFISWWSDHNATDPVMQSY
jgi:hypothetical protein